MNMPEIFDLSCVNEQGEKERVVMIHAAIMGSIERFLSIAIEHYAGAFPVWLAPEQVRMLPVADRHVEFADHFAEELKEKGIRADVDASSESVPKKVRNAEHMKVPVMLVVGDKEASGEVLSVRRYGVKEQATLGKDAFVQGLLEEIQQRK
jgi:threonyl-tRNA synthetase